MSEEIELSDQKKEIFERFRKRWGHSIDTDKKDGYKRVLSNIDKKYIIKVCERFIEEYKADERSYFPRPIDFDKYYNNIRSNEITAGQKFQHYSSQECKTCNGTGLIPVLCKRESEQSSKATIYINYCAFCSCEKGQSILKAQQFNTSRKEMYQTHYWSYFDRFGDSFQFDWDGDEYDNYPEFVFDKYRELREEQIKLNESISNEDEEVEVKF